MVTRTERIIADIAQIIFDFMLDQKGDKLVFEGNPTVITKPALVSYPFCFIQYSARGFYKEPVLMESGYLIPRRKFSLLAVCFSICLLMLGPLPVRWQPRLP